MAPFTTRHDDHVGPRHSDSDSDSDSEDQGPRHGLIDGQLHGEDNGGGGDGSQVVGTTELYRDGEVRFIPTPTPDPTDPLNMSQRRKWGAVIALALYGGLVNSAESIIACLLPVFMMEYAGVDPRELAHGFDINTVGDLGGPPGWKVALLSTAPLLVSGVFSFALVPLSIAVGRRPVMIGCGLLSVVGGVWAGASTSLDSHIAARTVMAVGSGTIDSLIPLIVSDFMFIHERNRPIAGINASGAFIIVLLGVASPHMVTRLSWRWVYGLTTVVTFFTWIAIILLVPETRRIREPEELAGQEVYALKPGERRARLDHARYPARTAWSDYGVFNAGAEWRAAGLSVAQAFRTLAFPNVLWSISLNATVTGAHSGMMQLGTEALLAAGWPFEELGAFVVPVVLASPFVWLFGGFVADAVANALARRAPGGRRDPEAHLVNLALPIAVGFAACLVFGHTADEAAARRLPVWLTLVGIFLMQFTSGTVQSLGTVYLVESYPTYAGPTLVCASTFRLVVGFLWTFQIESWVEDMGYLASFAIYAAAILVVAAFLPFIILRGRRIRAWSMGRLDQVTSTSSSSSAASSSYNRRKMWDGRRPGGQPWSTTAATTTTTTTTTAAESPRRQTKEHGQRPGLRRRAPSDASDDSTASDKELLLYEMRTLSASASRQSGAAAREEVEEEEE